MKIKLYDISASIAILIFTHLHEQNQLDLPNTSHFESRAWLVSLYLIFARPVIFEIKIITFYSLMVS